MKNCKNFLALAFFSLVFIFSACKEDSKTLNGIAPDILSVTLSKIRDMDNLGQKKEVSFDTFPVLTTTNILLGKNESNIITWEKVSFEEFYVQKETRSVEPAVTVFLLHTPNVEVYGDLDSISGTGFARIFIGQINDEPSFGVSLRDGGKVLALSDTVGTITPANIVLLQSTLRLLKK